MLARSNIHMLILAFRVIFAGASSWSTDQLSDSVLDFKVHHMVANNTIHLKLDCKKLETGWIGFGLGEPTSGHMKGSDMVTATFANQKVTVEDRYAVFAPSTYSEENGNGYSGLTARIDVVQDWTLVSHTSESDRTVVYVTRKLNTGDNQDREIVPGQSRIVWAYGIGTGYVGYHGSNRGAGTSTFIPSVVVGKTHQIPNHNGSWVYKMKNYTVQTLVTTYVCQSFAFPTDKERHIVAIRPRINPETKAYPHHAILHVCKNDAYWASHQQPTLCSAGAMSGSSGRPGGQPIPNSNGSSTQTFTGISPAGFRESACSSLAWSWAVGMGDFILPDEAGFRVGSKPEDLSHVILEIHYDNPGKKAGIVDTSGFEVFYTDTFRAYDAAGMTLGDPILNFRNTGSQIFSTGNLPAGTTKIHRQASCPSECTQSMKQDITVFASFLHMHNFGEKMYTQHYIPGREKPETTNRIDFWDNGFQSMYEKKPYVVKPGDSLQTHCWFNTAGKDTDIHFGIATVDEMCMDFIFYYPRQYKGKDAQGNDLLLGMCGLYYPSEQSAQLTICGSLADVSSGVLPGLPGFIMSGQKNRGSDGYADPLMFGAGPLPPTTTAETTTTTAAIQTLPQTSHGTLAQLTTLMTAMGLWLHLS